MTSTLIISEVEEIVEDVGSCDFEAKISSERFAFEDMNGTIFVEFAFIHLD